MTEENKNNFMTPPCNIKKRDDRFKQFLNSCPYIGPNVPISFPTLNMHEIIRDSSSTHLSVEGQNFSEKSVESLIEFIAQTNENLRAELQLLKSLVEAKIDFLSREISIMEGAEYSKLAKLFALGTIEQHRWAIDELTRIVALSSDLEKSFAMHQKDFFQIMQKLKEKQKKIEAVKGSLNKKAQRLLEGFFNSDRKEQIRRRCEAIALELEVEYLNDDEEQCFEMKSQISELVPELKRIRTEITRRVRAFVVSQLNKQAKIISQTKNESLKAKMCIVKVRHSHAFGKDGIPIIK